MRSKNRLVEIGQVSSPCVFEFPRQDVRKHPGMSQVTISSQSRSWYTNDHRVFRRPANRRANATRRGEAFPTRLRRVRSARSFE